MSENQVWSKGGTSEEGQSSPQGTSKSQEVPTSGSQQAIFPPKNISQTDNDEVFLVDNRETAENAAESTAGLDGCRGEPVKEQERPKPSGSPKRKKVAREKGFCLTIENYAPKSLKKVQVAFSRQHPHIPKPPWYNSLSKLMLLVMTIESFDGLCQEFRELKPLTCAKDCYCVFVLCWKFYEQLYESHPKTYEFGSTMPDLLRLVCNKHPIIYEVLRFLEEHVGKRKVRNPLPQLQYSLGQYHRGGLCPCADPAYCLVCWSCPSPPAQNYADSGKYSCYELPARSPDRGPATTEGLVYSEDSVDLPSDPGHSMLLPRGYGDGF